METEGNRTGRLLARSLPASFLWHAFLIYVGLGGPLLPHFHAPPKSVLDLELVSRERRWEVNKAGGDLSGPHTLSGLHGLSGIPFPDRDMRTSVRDMALEGAMREIKVKIGRLWDAADPPGFGRVRLMLAVGAGGEVINVGLSEESGVEKLDAFLVDMVKSAGPFPEAMRGLNRPLVVELEFTVRPGTGRTAG